MGTVLIVTDDIQIALLGCAIDSIPLPVFLPPPLMDDALWSNRPKDGKSKVY
jgi:hypothetical protein